ncbi:MAG: ATP-binding cassette domain-containing protein [Nitrospirota bacterium]
MIERIQALNIKKQYNSKFELDCSLDIKNGPIYTIVGPNGSGKSTLLRILSLIEKPDNGSVIYHDGGKPLAAPFKDIEISRMAVLVATRSNIFNDTVYNNIAYGLKLRKFNKKEIKDRVMSVLKDVRLDGKERMNAMGLSSGESQRLALARAFAINPDILFLDEPTASLDPDNTRVIEDIITEWQRKSDKIIIIVTHSLPQAKAISDFVIFIYKGKIIELSGVDNFFEKPSTKLAEKFVFGEVY